MSEFFLAEARILVRPDTTKFRAELEASLALATKVPITIPVTPIVTGGIAAATAETNAFTAAQVQGATAVKATNVAIEEQVVVDKQLAAAQAQHTAQLSQLTRGAGASGLSLLGLRGATLAASGAFLAGTAAVVAFSKAVGSAASLETELNVFRVTSGATADEMARVSAEARALGKDLTLPGVTANDAAVALTELSKAGLSVEDSLAGARGALQLATAAQIDNVTATKLVAGALNAFNLAGSDAVKVADLLTGAAKESQGEISDMGTALSQVAAVSKQFGVTLPDTVTLLTELAQAGLSGGRAGTSLRVAFLRLVNPTKDAAAALDNLNVHIRDSTGNLRPGVFTDIAEALQGYTKAQRDATLATIFGSDAIRAAAIIGNKGTLAFLETSAAINEMGLAQEQAAARTAGLEGATENLKNQISGLGLEIGDASKGPLTSFVKALADIASNASGAAGGIKIILGEINHQSEELSKTGVPAVDNYRISIGKIIKLSTQMNPIQIELRALNEVNKRFGESAAEATPKLDKYGNAIDGVGGALSDLSKNLLQSAADSRVFTVGISSDIRTLGQSAADSRVDISKLGQVPLPAAKRFNVKRLQNVIQGFDSQAVRDQIAGDNKALVADLQAEQTFLINELKKQGVKNRPALQRALEQELLGVTEALRGVAAKAASDAAKAKADADQAIKDAAAAASKQVQSFLTGQGLARDQRQNKIQAAAQTAGLQDDINQEKLLKALVLKQIAAINDRIKDEKVRVAAVTALRGVLNTVNAAISDLVKQQKEAQDQQRQNLIKSASLDIDFAQTVGNRTKEISAREALIVQLKKEQQTVKRGTVEWKQLRNDIAAQNQAIKELNGERDKQKNLFATATFDFLQAQQGFASNLLGNLIPGGATGGLVGGGDAVGAALNPVAGAAGASAKSGPTAGQANSTNHLLSLILEGIKRLNGTAAAPEAQRQRSGQNAIFDYTGGY